MWTEKDQEQGIQNPSNARTQELNQIREESLPVAQREADAGIRPFEPIDFQPVKSPSNYEAEFAVKGEDVIFHFWPWAFHDAQSKGHTPPYFRKDFREHLTVSMSKTFGPNRLQIEEDKDMGAFFVKAVGFGLNSFFRNLCIEACEDLHTRLEG